MIDGIITLALLHTYCAMCCAELAKGKNKTIKTAIICGLLFGLFGVFYYLLINKNDDEGNGQPPIAPTI